LGHSWGFKSRLRHREESKKESGFFSGSLIPSFLFNNPIWADLGRFSPAEGMTQGMDTYARGTRSGASSIRIDKFGCHQDKRSTEQDAILEQISVRRKSVRIASCILGFFLVLVTTTIGWSQSAPGAGNQGQHKSSSTAAPLEDFERRIGPLKIERQNFTVVLHLKRVRVPGVRAIGTEETVTRMEIWDDAGNIHYAKSFPCEVVGAHFAETMEISAQMLQGSQDSGLLISYGEDPSTPLGGGSYQVFGMFNGKLVPAGAAVGKSRKYLHRAGPASRSSALPRLVGECLCDYSSAGGLDARHGEACMAMLSDDRAWHAASMPI
jgi:hypothetical protein